MLAVKDLHFSIKGTPILNGISFHVEPGQTVGIIGPNGSGKTTLFNCISGFNKPSSGSINFNGDELVGLAPYKRARRGVGRVFQTFGVFKQMTLEENLLTAVESRQPLHQALFPWGSRRKRNIAKSVDYLKQVGLDGKRADRAVSLSGGQMRLLEIVRALAFGAELFLLDEPTAGVSPRMKDDVEQLIRKLQERECTILIIEHDINFIQKFCDRIIVLDVGRVVLDDTPEKVRSDSRLQDIYFGTQAEEGAA